MSALMTETYIMQGLKPNRDNQPLGLNGVLAFNSLSRTVAPVSSWKSGTYSVPLKSTTETTDKRKIPASSVVDHSVMHQNGRKLSLDLTHDFASSKQTPPANARSPLKWDWEIEHQDRKRERRADAALHGAPVFEVDRRVLKDVVREKMGVEVGRITFLSAGTFHKAYLIILVNHIEMVARVARRYMPRLKTESEVATIDYLREKSNVPVPTIYHYDSNPYNRLGGEFILMSKAQGIPLANVFHSLAYNDLVKLLKNLAAIVIPLFAHRFSEIGSLYFGPDPHHVASGAPTPKASQLHYSAFPFSPSLSMSNLSNSPVTAKPSIQKSLKPIPREYHVGPIISWPFFGSNRGELIHPHEVNRGPWASTHSYLTSCVDREIKGVIWENEGRAAPHRLHLDPDEIISSRHHHLKAVPGDESDESDEWDLEESEEEWEGPGDVMYRDYRRMQRSTFLVAHMSQREDSVRKEMERWMRLMDHLVQIVQKDRPEEFGLDCHDLSLENVFVDAEDNTKITCIIDWESTTTRPLWACAHVPAFLQSSPFISKLFREAVAQLPSDTSIQLPKVNGKDIDIAALCREWLYYESSGVRLRMAHRCAEWDGWEEGLVESILGPEEHGDEWFKFGNNIPHHAELNGIVTSPPESADEPKLLKGGIGIPRKLSSKLPFVEQQQKEQVLNTTGDICGGRGGELGRRLEAWLTVSGAGAGDNGVLKDRWREVLDVETD